MSDFQFNLIRVANPMHSEDDLPFLVAHLSIYSSDGGTRLDVVGPGGRTPAQQLLYGNLVSSPHILRNLQGRQGVYFLFPDVSIRWRGQFQLCVTLAKLPRSIPFNVTVYLSLLTFSTAAYAQEVFRARQIKGRCSRVRDRSRLMCARGRSTLHPVRTPQRS